MELILLRHGQAEDSNPSGDAARRLTEKGISQSRRTGRLLLDLDQRPEVVLCSPRVRCRETAEIFSEAAQMPGPVIQPWLDCGMSPDEALDELRAFGDFESVMLVGHEPDFSSLVESLLGVVGGAAIEVKKGAVVGLSVEPSGRGAVLRFLLPPKWTRRVKGEPTESPPAEE